MYIYIYMYTHISNDDNNATINIINNTNNTNK